MEGKVWWNFCQSRDEVVFKCSDCLLCFIGLEKIWCILLPLATSILNLFRPSCINPQLQCSGSGTRYHPSDPWGLYVFLLLVCLCTTTFLPSGLAGVVLQLKVTFRTYSANSCGLIHDGRKRLRIEVASGRSIHQIWRGKCGGIVVNPAMKWSLNVLIAFNASLVLQIFGGTSWISSLLICKY